MKRDLLWIAACIVAIAVMYPHLADARDFSVESPVAAFAASDVREPAHVFTNGFGEELTARTAANAANKRHDLPATGIDGAATLFKWKF